MANTAEVRTRIEPPDLEALAILARRRGRSIAAETRLCGLCGDRPAGSEWPP